MSTYLINHLRIPGGVPNEGGLRYLEQVEATVRPYGGRWLAQGDVRVVEGAWPGSAVLMEFPSLTAAQDWYNSAEYQRILHLRIDNVISDLVLIEGVAPDFTVAGFARQIRSALATTSPDTDAIGLLLRSVLDRDPAGGRIPGDPMSERLDELAQHRGGQCPIDPAVPLGQLRVVVVALSMTSRARARPMRPARYWAAPPPGSTPT